MLAREIILIKAGNDLKYRDKIYRAYLSFIEGGADSYEEYCAFYFYLKKNLGVQLSANTEKTMVARAARMKPSDLRVNEIRNAENAGVFSFLPEEFTKWQAVLWGRLCCESLFSQFGVSSQDFLEMLDLHLIRGSKKIEAPPRGFEKVQALVLTGAEIPQIVYETGKTRAEVYACLWFLSAA